MKAPTANRRVEWDKGNMIAARVILADPLKYPVGSFPELWARLLMRRLQPQAGPDFEEKSGNAA